MIPLALRTKWSVFQTDTPSDMDFLSYESYMYISAIYMYIWDIYIHSIRYTQKYIFVEIFQGDNASCYFCHILSQKRGDNSGFIWKYISKTIFFGFFLIKIGFAGKLVNLTDSHTHPFLLRIIYRLIIFIHFLPIANVYKNK